MAWAHEEPVIDTNDLRQPVRSHGDNDAMHVPSQRLSLAGRLLGLEIRMLRKASTDRGRVLLSHEQHPLMRQLG